MQGAVFYTISSLGAVWMEYGPLKITKVFLVPTELSLLEICLIIHCSVLEIILCHVSIY